MQHTDFFFPARDLAEHFHIPLLGQPAQKTSVYAEIRQVLESYTDEERKRDAVSCDRLMQMAKDEIAKENNYLNLVKAGKLKSKDRLEVSASICSVPMTSLMISCLFSMILFKNVRATL